MDGCVNNDISYICNNISVYLSALQKNYLSVFNRCKNLRSYSFIKDATILDDFYLSEGLNFRPTEIANNSNIYLDIITMTIGTSRVLSMSAFIDPLFCLRQILTFEPMIELCFFASFLSTPVLFYWGIQHMMTARKISSNSTHPMIDLMLILNKQFGSFLAGNYF